jgi:hypothetical protein
MVPSGCLEPIGLWGVEGVASPPSLWPFDEKRAGAEVGPSEACFGAWLSACSGEGAFLLRFLFVFVSVVE